MSELSNNDIKESVKPLGNVTVVNPAEGKKEPEKPVIFMCCFCGDAIMKDPELAVMASWGPEDTEFQQWWAHPACFRSALHEKARNFHDDFPT